MSTAAQVEAAATAYGVTYSAISANAAASVVYATSATHVAEDAVYAAADAAARAAKVLVWNNARDVELVRLREVVANACLTFPG